jgi:hypothetical protein
MVLIVIVALVDWYIEYLSYLSIKEADDKLKEILTIVDSKLNQILTAAKESGVKEGVEIKLDNTVKQSLENKLEKVAEKVAEKVVEKTGHSLIEGGNSLLEKSTLKDKLIE